MSDKPSNWQQSIEGEWHGMPSIFEPDGTHVGFNKVYRSSVFENGMTTYYMDTVLDAVGPLSSRFEAQKFAFGVKDSDSDRIYMGPDFVGAGHPYGALVDAHYYSPGWTSDLRTMVHVVNGDTQIYSSLLFDGPTLNGVFNGIYKVAFDYHTNTETKQWIDEFVASEAVNGKKAHVLPMKHSGSWSGEMVVYDANQEKIGVNEVEMGYRPTSLLSADMHIKSSGIINREWKFGRYRNNNRHSFTGPDLFGNGIGYGRANYTSQHFYGESLKIKGREFIIDADCNMSVVWQFYASDRMLYTTFGVLNWTPEKEILSASY